jgi:bifunctional DNase/RNase
VASEDAAAPPRFCVVEVLSVDVALPDTHAVVHLQETEKHQRVLSIPIGLTEGAALVAAQERRLGPRPSTHELFSEVLARANLDVIAVRLVEEEDGIYFAELDLMGTRGREVVPCRPSDAMILALRQRVPAPLLVDERLF